MKYLFLLFLSSCGINAHVDDITVKHKVSIDFEQVVEYCNTQCHYSDVNLQKVCTDDCFTRTVNAIYGSFQ